MESRDHQQVVALQPFADAGPIIRGAPLAVDQELDLVLARRERRVAPEVIIRPALEKFGRELYAFRPLIKIAHELHIGGVTGPGDWNITQATGVRERLVFPQRLVHALQPPAKRV